MTVDPSISHLPKAGSTPETASQEVSNPAPQRSVRAALGVAGAFALVTTALIAGTAAAEDSSADDPSPLAGAEIATVDLSTAADLSGETTLSITRPVIQQRSVGEIAAARSISIGGIVASSPATAHNSPVPHSAISTEQATTTEEPAQTATEETSTPAQDADETDTVETDAVETSTPDEADEVETADEAGTADETETADETGAADEAETADETENEDPEADTAVQVSDESASSTEAATGTEDATEQVGAEGESEEPSPAASTPIQISTEQPDILFPVVGPVTYIDTWGACRGVGCSRSHKGVDIFGHKLAPMIAVADGVISGERRSAMSISGNTVVVTGDDGWRYIYVHLNNDAPGTDDGSNPQAWIIPNRLRVGDRVKAGDVIAYLGDSGNAETTPAHLHFEIHKPGVGAINPTPMVREAEQAGRVVGVPSLASTPEGRAEHEPTIVAWYQALLKRDPTDAELFAWADRFDIGFANKNDLIADLTMAKPRRDPAGAIVRSFRVALDRLPTLNEIRLWEEAYRNGITLEGVAKTLVESAPFESEHGALTDAQFVTVVYQNAVGAAPSDQRLSEWLDQLNDGASRASVAAYLADSYSVKNSTWHGLEVIQSYRAGLDRMPTGEEYSQWVAHLDGGGLIPDVVEGIRGVD